MDIDIEKNTDAVEESPRWPVLSFLSLKIFRSHDLLRGSSMLSYLRLS